MPIKRFKESASGPCECEECEECEECPPPPEWSDWIPARYDETVINDTTNYVSANGDEVVLTVPAATTVANNIQTGQQFWLPLVDSDGEPIRFESHDIEICMQYVSHEETDSDLYIAALLCNKDSLNQSVSEAKGVGCRFKADGSVDFTLPYLRYVLWGITSNWAQAANVAVGETTCARTLFQTGGVSQCVLLYLGTDGSEKAQNVNQTYQPVLYTGEDSHAHIIFRFYGSTDTEPDEISIKVWYRYLPRPKSPQVFPS